MKIPFYLYLVFVLAVDSCTPKDSTSKVESNVSQANASFKHTIIGTSSAGHYTNYNFLIESASFEPEKVKEIVLALREQYCPGAEDCNVFHLWKDRKAFELLEYKHSTITLERFGYNKDKWLKAEAKWNKKHWVFVCENLIADYNATVKELDLYPFFDSQYREYGGKMKRPENAVIELAESDK